MEIQLVEVDDLKDDALFVAEFSLCCRCPVLLSSTFKQNVKYIHYRLTMAAIVQVSLGLVQIRKLNLCFPFFSSSVYF